MKAIVLAYHNLGCLGLEALLKHGIEVQAVFTHKGKSGSKIYAMDFDGSSARSLSKNDSINLLPAFSPSGSQVAFTSYMRGSADLYVTSAGGGGRPKRIAKHDGMNTGAATRPYRLGDLRLVAAGFGRLWDPGVFDRLQVPLTRYHD